MLPGWRRDWCLLLSHGPGCCYCLNAGIVTGKNVQVCAFSQWSLVGRAISCKALLWPFSSWERLENSLAAACRILSCPTDWARWTISLRSSCVLPANFLCLMTFAAHSGLQLISSFHLPVILLGLVENEVWRCSCPLLYSKPSGCQCWKGEHIVVLQLSPKLWEAPWLEKRAQFSTGENLIALVFQYKC